MTIYDLFRETGPNDRYFYDKEIVKDKSIRQELFYILRRHEYMNAFYEALKKHNLYQDYYDMSDDFFRQIINEWQEEHNIKI